MLEFLIVYKVYKHPLMFLKHLYIVLITIPDKTQLFSKYLHNCYTVLFEEQWQEESLYIFCTDIKFRLVVD